MPSGTYVRLRINSDGGIGLECINEFSAIRAGGDDRPGIQNQGAADALSVGPVWSIQSEHVPGCAA